MQPPWTKGVDFTKKPIFVCWEVTKSCLLACRHCRAKAIRRGLPGELDFESGLRLVEQIKEFGDPYPALLLTGGDPLMRPDVMELVRYAKEQGIYTAVAASVTPLLTVETMVRMKELGVDIVSVSLDGATPRTHDALRGVPGTWSSTIRAVQNARACGLRMQVNTTVMRSNIRELADIFHVSKEAGAVAWEVFFLVRTGRGAVLEDPGPSECEDVMHFLYDATQYGIPVRTSEGPQFRRVYMQRQKGAGPPSGELYEHLSKRLRELEGGPSGMPSLRLNATGDGKGVIFVGYDGEVYPSGFLPLPLGNVKSGRLAEIYRSHPTLVGLRDPSRLEGRCSVCDYGTICGGSRSRAYAEYENPLQSDPACPYIPA